VGQAFFHQLARRLHLRPTVRAVQRAQVDHQHGVAADALGQIDVALDGNVALGVRHDRQQAADAQLEQLVLQAGRHDLGVNLEKEGRAVAVHRHGAVAQATK
jgi:hypothetical protein